MAAEEVGGALRVIRRRVPLKHTPLKRSSNPIARKVPIRKRRKGPPRRGPFRDKEYLAFLRAAGVCACCGNPRVVPAHGPTNGTSSKGPDNLAVALCHLHHDIADRRRKLPDGTWGRAALEERYGISLEAVAAHWWALYQADKEARSKH
jgi:hypothetical protein